MNERTVTVAALAALGVIVILGGIGVWWLHSDLSTANDGLAKVSKDVTTAETKERDLPKLNARSLQLEQEIKSGEERIPTLDDSQYDGMVELLDELRRFSSTSISDARYVSGRSQQGVPPSMHRVSYDISVTGAFFNLLRFLNLLEAQRRFIAVQSFTIVPGGGEANEAAAASGASATRSMKVNVYTFTRKPMNLPGGEPAAVRTTEVEKPAITTPMPN